MDVAQQIIIVLGTPQGSSGPTAPVLTLLSVVGTAASFSIDVDDTVVAGDTVTLQVQAAGGNWSSLVVNTTHTITSGEDGANEVDLTPAGFANGNYEARAKCHHTTDSGWSNTVSFTVAAAVFSLTATDNATDISATSPVTYGGKSFAIGAAGSTRRVCVGICSRDSGGISAISGVMINAGTDNIVCTKAIAIINGGQSAEIWYANVPNLTTCTVRVTYAGAYTRSGIDVWSVIAPGNSGAPTATATGIGTATDTQGIDTPATTITIPTGGAAVGICFSQSGGPGTPTGSPAGFNVDFNSNFGGLAGTQEVWGLHSAAGAVVGAGTALSTTLVGNSGCALAVAVWGP